MPVKSVRRRLAPLAFALVMAACTQSAAPAAVACPPVPSGARPGDAPYGQVWVGTRVNVNGIDEVDPLVARPFFDAPTAYVVESGNRWPWMGTSQRTAYFTSEAEFERYAGTKAMRGLDAVLYDPEAWEATPLAEQRDPGAAMAKFGELGHRLGYDVIITPGFTLPSVSGAVCTANPGESATDAYLRCGVARKAAVNADVVEVQSQTLQGQPGAYRDFVGSAADQAREANPDVSTISGLRVRQTEILDDVKRTWVEALDVTDGYYLAMRPDDGAELLGWIYACAQRAA
jgi:hypothetical protein